MDDFRKFFNGVLIVFVLGLIVWISMVYIAACGLSFACHQGQPFTDRTPVPTLAAATLPVHDFSVAAPAFKRCRIAAVTLIGDWVSAGYSETEPFTFTDENGNSCQASFTQDVQSLFLESNLWYPGSLACASCHSPDVKNAVMNMDLSSYAGILAGSHRPNAASKGNDILGGGNWDQALLHQMLYAPNGKTLIGRPPMPFGRTANVPANGPVIFAGTQIESTSADTVGTPTLASPPESAMPETTVTSPAVEEIARPSNPGGPGDAIHLNGNATAGSQVFQANCAPCHGPQGTQGILNPGSDDGTVPSLNPIDPTLPNPDYKTFATNLDLFIQNGSTPAGSSPVISMPAWGAQNLLPQQQIADVIAYLISLNH